jgi:hypothetical protein
MPDLGPGWIQPQKRSEPLAQTGHFRALEIYLAVESHEQLHGIQLPFIGRQGASLLHKLLCQILDGVAQDLQGSPRLLGDVAASG